MKKLNSTGTSNHIVAYMLKATTVEAQKLPLLGNCQHTRSRGKRHVRCDVTQQQKRCCRRHSLWVRAAFLPTQLCGDHISAAVNEHATVEEAVFSVGPPRGYITKVSSS
jgi:hypothetical protein